MKIYEYSVYKLESPFNDSSAMDKFNRHLIKFKWELVEMLEQPGAWRCAFLRREVHGMMDE